MLLSSRASSVPATCSPGKVGAGKERRWRGDAAGGRSRGGTRIQHEGKARSPSPRGPGPKLRGGER